MWLASICSGVRRILDRQSVKNALALAQRRGFASIAFPLIGAGVGGCSPDKVMEFMKEEMANSSYDGEVLIVRFYQRAMKLVAKYFKHGRGNKWKQGRQLHTSGE